MRFPLFAVFATSLSAFSAPAADLILLDETESHYQIVIPDKLPSEELTECLNQTARLLQTAFEANDAEVAIVQESALDATRPSLFLGDTAFAKAQGIDLTELRDWSYLHRVVGENVIVAGHDHPARAETTNARRPNWDRVGTAKAAVDFAREFMGVRFLYPDVRPNSPVSSAANVDLLTSPAIEFLPIKTMTVPADLNGAKTPLLRLNTAHPAGGGFYDLAHNRFPRVDAIFGSHTWERAVPAELYKEHPEYFALINDERLNPESGRAQYCLSNSEVQDRIYEDLASWFDRGYATADLGQPDGFRACQCDDCEKLYDTGPDWGEKIWVFNRSVAERLHKSHPGHDVTMMSYILTAVPPKTFQAFPPNTCVMLTGTNEEDIAPWRDIDVPRGFTGYIYNWCANLGTRYTPMRTPGFVEVQVKRLTSNRIQSLYRDGPGQLFGLEGPVYYTMGRMFDDPGKNSARDLLPEFMEAAFRNKSAAFYMRSFYDRLYNAIALYSDHIGTRNDIWTIKSLPDDTRGRKTVRDPFQLIAFLYTPNLLASLESDLAQAEMLVNTDKAKIRLSLIRTEFEYVDHLARVVHLYQAYQVLPDEGSRARLLNAIDKRNAYIAALYEKGRQAEWAYVLFPFPGHNADHLRLTENRYQEPFAHTCLNWDTAAMRKAPAPGKKSLTIDKARAAVTLDSPQWAKVETHELTLIPPLNILPRQTTLRLLYDEANLYLRTESELEPDGPTEFKATKRDQLLTKQESIDFYFQPQPAREIFYRFGLGANAESKYDAASGFIADVMDPRHGKDDSTWNGEWQAETRIDTETHRWHALITIPFKDLAVDTPAPGTHWRANFSRNHLLPRGKIDRSIWSSAIGNSDMNDRSVLGEIVFE